jgi:DNA-binding response OmpR family regulator/anti-sigma regulatory factor (Ser/Thr protein kinase)
VLGLSSLLKDQALGELNQRQVHYAQLIHQSGRHLMTVVNDILDMTRMETGQLELSLEPVNIGNVCQQAYDHALQLRLAGETSPEAAQALPEFALEIEPGIEFLVADEVRLQQMLMHLLLNALKFTETGKHIGLKVNRWGGWIAFTVWDTGPGIPADKQHLIFQKFQQLENPLNRRFEGTGLGLVLTQRLARLHGGDVTFISKEGQGSQFTILLPPRPPSPRSPSPEQNETSLYSLGEGAFVEVPAPVYTFEQDPAKPIRNRLVLIVEATPYYIETLSDHLTYLGYQVAIARAGTEAVEKARCLQPCVILLNPVLPLLSGWDVLTLLKSNPETLQIPIVITASKADEAQATERQADGVLHLPVQVNPLKRVLKKLVQDSFESTSTDLPNLTLTVLRLTPSAEAADTAIANSDLTILLRAHQYRILEADSLDQAELLARVWKPNVVLIDGSLGNPAPYFQQLSRCTLLASLPLVTLNQEMTQAANQIADLQVFPCLSNPDPPQTSSEEIHPNTLLQVMQIAAGHTWQPTILAIDLAALPDSREVLAEPVTEQSAPVGEQSHPGDRFPQEIKWLHALNQYLQAAGFRSVIGRSWQEVWQQVQTKSIDLLLICWTDTQLSPTASQILATLAAIKQRPPVLVLDHRTSLAHAFKPLPHSLEQLAPCDLPPLLQQLAHQTLPSSVPITELLEQMSQMIRNQQLKTS